MAGVLLKDHFPSTDDMKGYACIHSDSQQVSDKLKIFLFSIRGARKTRERHRGKAGTHAAHGKQKVPRALLSSAGLEAPVHGEHVTTAAHVSREQLANRASGTKSL